MRSWEEWRFLVFCACNIISLHSVANGGDARICGQYAFGEKLGLWIVVPQQLIVQVGVDIVYMITVGQSLQKFHHLVCRDCKKINLTYFIMILASVHFLLSQLPNIHSISGVSLAASLMPLRYVHIPLLHLLPSVT